MFEHNIENESISALRQMKLEYLFKLFNAIQLCFIIIILINIEFSTMYVNYLHVSYYSLRPVYFVSKLFYINEFSL